MLCVLEGGKRAFCASELAQRQGVSRSAMSYRLKKLEAYGLIGCRLGAKDKRTTLYEITSVGEAQIKWTTEAMESLIGACEPLHRSPASRLACYVEAAGGVFCSAKELVLLCLFASKRPLYLTQIQRRTGLIQPTCSISVRTLVEEKAVKRVLSKEEFLSRSETHETLPDPMCVPSRKASQSKPRQRKIALTDAGKARAQTLANKVEAIIVPHLRHFELLSQKESQNRGSI